MIQRVGSSAKPRKWMSVHEMGDMLGLKKTDRYWLVHKNYFRTETLLGKMRVEIASFEKWYANQDWYHKVNGEAPGKELRLRSYSPKEIQEMLGTDNATVYEILKKNNIETVTVNERMRVPTDAFWDWYYSQSRYRTQEDRKKDAAAEAASLSMPEMARLLDVPRSTVYGILSSKKYAPLLDVIVIAGRRRVTKESFERFLQAQDTYELYLYVNKEVQRDSKKALEELDQKDVIVIFPEERKTNKTVRIMKTPKTESSVRKVFLPRSVAEELIAWKAQQEEIKDILQEEYQDYGLILATEYGLPRGGAYIRDSLNKLIKQHDLPQIVFHSFRHMSVTYKLKLNGGDIKAVQGDSGHAQADMVTEVYSHIIDEDRRRNATLLEDSFYNRKNLNPQIHDTEKRTMMEVPEGVDAELLAKVLSNPEMAVLLTSLAKSMQGEHN